jgi:hypothetical protein
VKDALQSAASSGQLSRAQLLARTSRNGLRLIVDACD